jgi:hypothetical protein
MQDSFPDSTNLGPSVTVVELKSRILLLGQAWEWVNSDDKVA